MSKSVPYAARSAGRPFAVASSQRNRLLASTALVVGLSLTLPGAMLAQTWTGSTDTDWTDGTNWSSTPFAPAAAGNVVINGTGNALNDPALSADSAALNSVTISGTVGTPRTLTVTAVLDTTTGGTTVNANGTLALAAGGTVVGAVNINGGGSLGMIGDKSISTLGGTGNGIIYLGNDELTIGGSNTASSYAGMVSGNSTSELIKTGTATMTVSGDFSTTGGVTVEDGTLELSGKAVVPPSDPLLDQYRRKLSMMLN